MFPRKESTFLKLLLFTASFGKKKKEWRFTSAALNLP